MTFYEKLPEHCPPDDAKEQDNIDYYRLCLTDPAGENDFLSHRALNPDARYNVPECRTRSLSVFQKLTKVKNLQKSGPFKKKTTFVGKVTLTNQDGVVKQTGNAGHFSWWRSDTFQVTACQIEP
jgi:hypothetical protein